MTMLRRATSSLLRFAGVPDGRLPSSFYDLSVGVRLNVMVVFTVALLAIIVPISYLVSLI